MLFKNREHAANSLIPFLKKFSDDDCVVLAVPRGGLPIGYVISTQLGFPLDILLTKKIGHPSNPEWAVGAVSLEGMVKNNSVGLPDEYFYHEAELLRKSLFEKYKFYSGGKKPIELKNKTVIIVDDGIATGNTIKAAIEMIRKKLPKKIIVAVPVAPIETAAELNNLVDEFICLKTPEDFMAVGQYYFDFSAVSDEEAISLFRLANKNYKLQ